ncbi:hypothetical protein KKG46_01350 [Patescibacteria group bacterium]|nr:hypothetical protein [Patescibacteria group bacterium]
MAKQASILKNQLKIRIQVLASNQQQTDVLWQSLLKQAVELDYYEQMFQLIREKNRATTIAALRRVVLSLYENKAINGDRSANNIVLAFARTMSDVRLLSRFWLQTVTEPTISIKDGHSKAAATETFSAEPDSKRMPHLLPDLSTKI